MRCCHIVIWLVLLAALSPAPAQSRCADLLRDINQQPLANPGSGPIGPKVELNGSIYFTATTQSNGAELYRCTASTGSAQLVKDIRPGSSGSDPTQLLAFGNQAVDQFTEIVRNTHF